MRIIGILLVLIGGLTLGYEGIVSVAREPKDSEYNEVERKKSQSAHIPPVVGGIVVVSGLLLLASENKRDEN